MAVKELLPAKKTQQKCIMYLDNVPFVPPYLKFAPGFIGTEITLTETKGDIYAQKYYTHCPQCAKDIFFN